MTITTTRALLYPAYLYTGPTEVIREQAQNFIQQVLCLSGGCMQCVVCLQVSVRQHYLVRWLSPQGGYTLAALESVFKTIPFKLDTHEHLFFVLEHADMLSLSCSNKLLKSLEEPPSGYHFILLASCQEAILPTVRSRCVIYNYTGHSIYEHPVLSYFTSNNKTAVGEFAKDLDALKVTEHDYMHILDALNNYLLQEYKKLLMDTSGTYTKDHLVSIEKKLALLQEMRTLPLMSGSAKIFFKNLYLRFL